MIRSVFDYGETPFNNNIDPSSSYAITISLNKANQNKSVTQNKTTNFNKSPPKPYERSHNSVTNLSSNFSDYNNPQIAN